MASMSNRQAVWRLPVAMAAVAACIGAIEFFASVEGILAPLNDLTATTTALAIRQFGLPVTLSDTLLAHPSGFRYQIGYTCTVFIPALIIVVLLAFGLPLGARQRLRGIVIGLFIVAAVNLLRLLGLYYVGAVAPDYYEFTHDWIGQAAMVITTVAIAFFWINTAARSRPFARA